MLFLNELVSRSIYILFYLREQCWDIYKHAFWPIEMLEYKFSFRYIYDAMKCLVFGK